MKSSLLVTCMLASLASCLPRLAETRLQKRSDDTTATQLEAVVIKLSADLAQLQAKHEADVNQLKAQHSAEMTQLETRLAKQEHHVAFHAQFSASSYKSPASGAFLFNNAVYNEGNGYDTRHGTFTAPIAGVYIFNMQLYTDGTQQHRPMFVLAKNGGNIMTVSFDQESSAAGFEQDSRAASTVVRMNVGDKVWVESTGSRSYSLSGIIHSYFSGALLYTV